MLWPHLTFWCLILMSVESTLWQLHGQASCIKPYVYFTVWGMHLHRRTCLHKHPLITTASDFIQDKKIRKTHFCVKINPIFPIYSSETIYFSTYIVHDLCWWAWDCRPTKLTCFVRQVRVSTLLYWLMWILK